MHQMVGDIPRSSPIHRTSMLTTLIYHILNSCLCVCQPGCLPQQCLGWPLTTPVCGGKKNVAEKWVPVGTMTTTSLGTGELWWRKEAISFSVPSFLRIHYISLNFNECSLSSFSGTLGCRWATRVWLLCCLPWQAGKPSTPLGSAWRRSLRQLETMLWSAMTRPGGTPHGEMIDPKNGLMFVCLMFSLLHSILFL